MATAKVDRHSRESGNPASLMESPWVPVPDRIIRGQAPAGTTGSATDDFFV